MKSTGATSKKKQHRTQGTVATKVGGSSTGKGLIASVQSWLDEQGFPLEMKTASAFRSAGFEVRQSSYYIDPESGKGREIDVLATDPDPYMIGATRIVFVIECKTSKKPWLLLQSPDTLIGYLRYAAFGVLSESALKAFLQHQEWIENLPWLKKPPLAGYAFRQALGDKDVAYSAVITVAKACKDIVGQEDGFPRFTLAFPVIVIDSPLISCSMLKNGKLRLKEVDSGEFLFLMAVPNHFGSCIRVVTESALPAFAKEAKQAATKFRAAFTPLESDLFDSWRQDNKTGG